MNTCIVPSVGEVCTGTEQGRLLNLPSSLFTGINIIICRLDFTLLLRRTPLNVFEEMRIRLIISCDTAICYLTVQYAPFSAASRAGKLLLKRF